MVLYQSPLFKAPFNLQSCRPYKLVKILSSSDRGPNLVLVDAAVVLLRAWMAYALPRAPEIEKRK